MRNIEELYEASNEDLPELYCDLDQVLVDFLKGAEKVVGQPFAKSDNKTRWSKISGTKERTDHTLNVTPGQSPEEFEKQVETMQAKNNYMREALAKMWGIDEGKNPFIKDAAKKQEEKKVKSEKTMTGKKATEVKVDPDLDK